MSVRMMENKQELSPKQQNKLANLEEKTAKKLEKCAAKLQKIDRKQERKRAKWTRRAARVRRKAARKKADILGVPSVEPIRRDLPALEKERKELSRAEATAKAVEMATKMAAKQTLTAEPTDLYARFAALSFPQLELLLRGAKTREEKAFYRSLLNLKLQIDQESVVGEVLL